jgi:hypothetical protein
MSNTGFDMMKTEIEEKMNKQKIDWVLKHFHCEGLDPHNRSIEWICETAQELNATIDIGGESRRHYSGRSFAIRVRGTSGVQYRISVHYRPRFAEMAAERFDEIDFSDDKSIGMLMHSFKYMLDYEIHWLDERDGDWEHICIHGHRDRPATCWPGDELVTTLLTLSDDLRQSLEKSMNTLRQTLCKSYMIAWCTHNTPSDVTWNSMTTHLKHLGEMEGASNEEEFFEARTIALAELYGQEDQS